MGEVVLRQIVENDDELRTRVVVTSAGTANWHVGQSMDPRARAALDRAGYLADGTLAAFADRSYIDQHDVIMVMTKDHRREIDARRTNPDVSIISIRDITEPGHGLEVADPYYGDDGDFDFCLSQLIQGMTTWTSALRRSSESSNEA
jgi:protein-tyrosine phosphatase